MLKRSSITLSGVTASLLLLLHGEPTLALTDADADTIQNLRRQVEELRADRDAKIDEIKSDTDQRIYRLERELERLAPPPIAAGPVAPAAAPQDRDRSRDFHGAQFSGDFRLRFEGNYGQSDTSDRERGVIRARLAALALSQSLAVGARIATGDADDPNSTDVTLSNFNDDLDVSLDQLYARFESANWTLFGGKFSAPMTRTEMVWDSDVNPEGVAAVFRSPWYPDNTRFSAQALYFIIDEQSAASDSGMAGAQLLAATELTPQLAVELSAAYYDYDLHTLANADAGDIRGNRLNAGATRYLSDFELLDVIASLQYRGLGAKWPVRLLGDYVRNLGAVDRQNTGYNVELSIGRVRDPENWRLTYGFSVVKPMLYSLLSHDNTQLSTNYRQHSLAVDYVPMTHTLVNATWYIYRPYHAGQIASSLAHDWVDRLRLNFVLSF